MHSNGREDALRPAMADRRGVDAHGAGAEGGHGVTCTKRRGCPCDAIGIELRGVSTQEHDGP